MNTDEHEKLLHKKLSYKIQGAAMEVRRNFGPGFKESIYQNAFAEELHSRGMSFEKEKPIQIFSPKTGKLVGSYRPDFIISDTVLVELKAVEKIPKMFLDQLYSYLRNSKYELGYLINFVSPRLYMKRVIFTNDRKPFLKSFFVCVGLLFVLLSVYIQAHAATLTFRPDPPRIGPNQLFKVDVFLDTQEEDINAIEGTLALTPSVGEIKKVVEGGSIVSFWLTQPKVNNSAQVVFSGVIPGGYQGKRGLLFSLLIGTKERGSGMLTTELLKVLQNDGQGTAVQASLSHYEVVIDPQAPASRLSLGIQDLVKPEIMLATITKDPDMFEGKWFLIFAAQDKETGIDRYEVQEAAAKKTNQWQRAQSPYVLEDQSLQSTVYLKAIDKEGNEQETVVRPFAQPVWFENYQILGILIVGIIVVFLFSLFLRRRFFG